MRILITGLGFLSTNIAKKLYEKSYDIEIYSRNTDPKATKEAMDYIGGKIPIIADDISSMHAKLKQASNVDYIFHFASPAGNMAMDRDPLQFGSAVNGTINVFELARKLGAKVIYASSATVYEETGKPLKETDKIISKNLYTASKIAIENIADYYRKKYMVRSVCLRIFAGYGKREEKKALGRSTVCEYLLSMMKDEKPEIWGTGEQAMDYVYSEDIAAIAVRTMFSNIPKLNVASGKATTSLELVKTINEALGKEIEPVFVKAPAAFMERAEGDITLLHSQFNFSPTPLLSGVKKYAEYLQEQKG